MPAPEESDSDNEDGEFDEYGDPTDGNGAYGGNGKAKDGANGGAGLQFTGDAESAQAREVLNFGKVVGDMVSTGHAEGHPASSLLMEIKGYKFAQNKVSCVILLTVARTVALWFTKPAPLFALPGWFGTVVLS
jgi:hypothetical protein